MMRQLRDDFFRAGSSRRRDVMDGNDQRLPVRFR
jgi:hypothetical protein